MLCPCGGSTIVKDGRLIEEGYWRRRRCEKCGAESTTLEQVCETIKGTRVKQPKVVVEKPPKVARPKYDRARPEKIQKAVRAVKARNTIEDINMQRELAKLEEY
jgi:Predicted transcriptional regulator, consists of a Zn-ribbon and ATP-cone domains